MVGESQLTFMPDLKDMTAAELQSLTPEECLALLPDYTADELHALFMAYADEWMDLSTDLVEWRIVSRERRKVAQARQAEVYHRKTVINNLEWWKRSNASLADIEAAFERDREIAEAERQYQEMWRQRDAAALAAGKQYAVWHKLRTEKKAKE